MIKGKYKVVTAMFDIRPIDDSGILMFQNF